MAIDKKKKPSGRIKKKLGEQPLRNRYHRHAKLSEYRFLKVLAQYASDISVAEAALSVRISEKTVRTLYVGFRGRMIAAMLNDPFAFGGAGRFLLDGRRLGDRGRRFLGEVGKSTIFKDHLKTHVRRKLAESPYNEHLLECAVRLFCTLSMRNAPEHYYPPETMEALKTFREIAGWISENREQVGFLEHRAELLTRFDSIIQNMPRLLEQEDLLALRTHSREHRFPGNVLYDDLRRYLLRDPL